jgi:hypothetical protein
MVWPIVENPLLASLIFEDFSLEPYSAPNGLKLFRLSEYAIANQSLFLTTGDVLVGIGSNKDIAARLTSKHFICVKTEEKQQNYIDTQIIGFDV